MSYPVKWFTSDMGGAPVLSGTAGSLVALLDACLVNGFGLLTLTSLSISGGVATATIDAGHGYRVGQILEIAGAIPVGLNGECRVSSVTATTFTFATTKADGTATGTITAKIPALGWTREYTGTHQAAYRQPDPAANGMYLYVNDARDDAHGAQQAWVRGYESMTAIDTGTGPFPTPSQETNGLSLAKSNALDTTSRDWALVGDPRQFFFMPAHHASYPDAADGLWFMEAIPYDSSDAYANMLWVQSHFVTTRNPCRNNNLDSWCIQNMQQNQ